MLFIKKKYTTCYISSLPDLILSAIFGKLPFTSLMLCRYVCRSWHSLLHNPDFFRFKFNPSMRKPTDLFLCIKQDKFYWLEFQGNRFRHFNFAAELNNNCLPGSLTYVNSCNGLVCLFQEDNSVMHIINPVTCEYISLPPFSSYMQLHPRVCGIGFDPETQKYKVLRSTCPIDVDEKLSSSVKNKWLIKAEVCTLDDGNGEGSGMWRTYAGSPWLYWYGDIYQPSGPAVFVNGCLHWLDESETEILAFDFKGERFRDIKMPDPILDGDYIKRENINIGVLGNSLYLCCSTWDTNVFDIWLLKDYANESWNKIIVSDNELSFGGRKFIQVIRVFHNGDVLLYKGPDLYLYNPELNSHTKLDDSLLGGIQSTMRPIEYSLSFASLKQICGRSRPLIR